MIIKDTTWHYKYYRFVKRLWSGEDTYIPCKTNLCAYVQCMIWGTVFWLFLLPLMPFQLFFYAIDIPFNMIKQPKHKENPPFVAKTFIGMIVFFVGLCAIVACNVGYTFLQIYTWTMFIIIAIAIAISLLIAFKSKICPTIHFDYYEHIQERKK